jgi:hypothetical protein
LPSKRLRGVSEGAKDLPATLSHVSEEDAFDIMPEALSRRPAAADDKAEDNHTGRDRHHSTEADGPGAR